MQTKYGGQDSPYKKYQWNVRDSNKTAVYSGRYHCVAEICVLINQVYYLKKWKGKLSLLLAVTPISSALQGRLCLEYHTQGWGGVVHIRRFSLFTVLMPITSSLWWRYFKQHPPGNISMAGKVRQETSNYHQRKTRTKLTA